MSHFVVCPEPILGAQLTRSVIASGAAPPCRLSIFRSGILDSYEGTGGLSPRGTVLWLSHVVTIGLEAPNSTCRYMYIQHQWNGHRHKCQVADTMWLRPSHQMLGILVGCCPTY